MTRRKVVVLGLLGPTLDQGQGPHRWDRWRPTVDLCRQEDLVVDRLDLLHQKKFASLGEQIERDILSVSPETEVVRRPIEFADPWDFQDVYGALHDFARDYPFDPAKEDYLVHITTGTHVAQICLFLLTESRLLPARLIQTSPPKGERGSAGSYSVIDLDLSKYDRIASRFRQAAKEGVSFLKGGIETRNADFNRLIARIEEVAIASKEPLLLTGPTGAGKSLLAKRIYELRKSRHQLAGPFVEVNCATLRGDAAMSALFGHVKGAFTGAVSPRPGLLRKADKGLLLLDEIGELGSDEQAMLLRALEEKKFLPVGGDEEVESDFQLIAGTNRELAVQVRDGRFREDLLARINLWTFRIPGLRERLEDVEPNVQFELREVERTTGAHVTFSKEARELFLRFATSPDAKWTGNFRDLNAAVVRMATLAPGGRISVEGVDDEIKRLRAGWATPGPEKEDAIVSDVLGPERADALDRFDRVQLADVLEACRGARSLSDAGRTLFAASRAKKENPNDADRLRKYLARFGLEWTDLKPAVT
ncbi:MAG TPA: RNA repair transcriptional activator RtcR [Planctomycetota bacterium]|nr:RNA repair transcriptional activator RtcR [Planctomycetota bacterium]